MATSVHRRAARSATPCRRDAPCGRRLEQEQRRRCAWCGHHAQAGAPPTLAVSRFSHVQKVYHLRTTAQCRRPYETSPGTRSACATGKWCLAVGRAHLLPSPATRPGLRRRRSHQGAWPCGLTGPVPEGNDTAGAPPRQCILSHVYLRHASPPQGPGQGRDPRTDMLSGWVGCT